MAGMYSDKMTINEIYDLMLKERECIVRRHMCDHNCTSCRIAWNTVKLNAAITAVIEMLKDKNPELHFKSDLIRLKEIIEDELKSKEIN